MKTNHETTTIQISKTTLKKVSAFCRKNRYIQRYWVQSTLERALKNRKGSDTRRSPE